MNLKKILSSLLLISILSLAGVSTAFAVAVSNDPNGVILSSVDRVQIRAGIDNATISYQITQPINDINISIYNGRNLVKTLLNANRGVPMRAGNYQVIWNGTDANGNNVPAAEYRYIITSSILNQGLTANITVINNLTIHFQNLRGLCLPRDFNRCLQPRF